MTILLKRKNILLVNGHEIVQKKDNIKQTNKISCERSGSEIPICNRAHAGGQAPGARAAAAAGWPGGRAAAGERRPSRRRWGRRGYEGRTPSEGGWGGGACGGGRRDGEAIGARMESHLGSRR